MLDLDLWAQVDSIKQSSATLCVLDVSHCRTSSFNDHLDHCLIVPQNVKHGFQVRRFCSFDNVINIRLLDIISVTVFLRLRVRVGVFALDFLSQRVSPCRNVIRRLQYFYKQVQEIKCGRYRPCEDQRIKVQRDNFGFGLFLTHLTYKNVCSTSEDTQNSTRRCLHQSLSLVTIPIDNAAPYYPHGNIVYDHSCDACRRSNEPSVCHRFEPILWQLVQVCLQTREKSSPPILTNYKHFKTMREHTLDNSPTVTSSSLLKLWSSWHGVATLYNCSVFLFASTQILFHALLRVTFHVIGPCDSFRVRFFPAEVIFQLLQQKFVVRTSFRIQQHQFLPNRTKILLSSSNYPVIHENRQEWTFVDD